MATQIFVRPQSGSTLGRSGVGPSGRVKNTTARETSLLEAVGKGIPATAIGIIDTFSSSLGITTDDELAQTMTQAVGINDFYNAHKDGVDIASAIGGLLLPATAATKLIQGSGKLAKLLGADRKGNPLKYMFTSTKVAKLEKEVGCFEKEI